MKREFLQSIITLLKLSGRENIRKRVLRLIPVKSKRRIIIFLMTFPFF